MTGPEMAAVLRGLSDVVHARPAITAEETVELVAFALGMSAAEKGNAARCRRYRLGRKERSAHVAEHVAPHVEHVADTPPPKPPPVSQPMLADTLKHVETMSGGMSPTPALPPTPPLSSPEKPAAAAADLDLKPRAGETPAPMSRDMPPRNLAEALAIEAVCVRAGYVVAAECDAQWVQPEKWPEVIGVEAALAKAEGRAPLPLGQYHRDAGVRAVVALYAAGYLPSTLRDVVTRLAADPWWKEGKRKGLSTLTPEVVRRALTSGNSPEERAARLLRQSEERDAQQQAAQAARGA